MATLPLELKTCHVKDIRLTEQLQTGSGRSVYLQMNPMEGVDGFDYSLPNNVGIELFIFDEEKQPRRMWYLRDVQSVSTDDHYFVDIPTDLDDSPIIWQEVTVTLKQYFKASDSGDE